MDFTNVFLVCAICEFMPSSPVNIFCGVRILIRQRNRVRLLGFGIFLAGSGYSYRMANFEWQTEEDISWDDLPTPTPPTPPRQQRWLLLTGLVGLLLLAGFVVYRQVQQRVETATQTVQADVLSSYNLVQRAATEGDEELFTSLLSGRDMAWVAGETALFKQGMLLNREPFGLEALPFRPQTAVSPTTTDEIPSDAARITLSPDLTEAEITITQPYLSNDTAQGTVLFQQTAVYRLGASRWLLAPPQAEFWGDWHTTDSDLLTVTYPQRDEAIAQRLTEDLTAILNEACNTLDTFTCLSGIPLHIDLELSDDPATLATTHDLTQLDVAGSHWRLKLPAPTLVGVPVDDAGYNILRDGYAGQVLTAVILHQANWECCDGQAFAEALITYQLNQLGLRPWPVAQADYQFIVDEDVAIAHFTPYWRNATFEIQTPRVDKKYIYPFIEFILFNTPEQSPQQLLQAIPGNRSLISWLYTTVPFHDPFGDFSVRASYFDATWVQFAYTQSLVTTGPPPVPLPEQTLTTMCIAVQQEPIQRSVMEQYDFAAETWSVLEEWEKYTLMLPLPDSSGLLLQQFDFTNNVPGTFLWQNGRLSTLYTNPDNPIISFGQTDPTGQTLLAFQFDPENESADFVALPQDCANRCTPQTLPGQPVWSPDGQHALFVQREALQFVELSFPNRINLYDNSAILDSGTPLSLGEASGQTLTDLGNGMAPFWLDNNTFGFIRLVPAAPDSPRRDIVIATLDDPTLQTLIAAEAFTATPPNRGPAPEIHLRYVWPHPTNPDLLLVVGVDTRTGEAHIWSYQQSTGEIQPLLSLGMTFGSSIGVSPNGRWLLLQGAERQNGTDSQVILLYNLETGETRRYVMAFSQFAPAFTYDWTADGEWLAYVVNGQMMGLTAVDHNYTQIIPSPSNNCAAIAWVNK